MAVAHEHDDQMMLREVHVWWMHVQNRRRSNGLYLLPRTRTFRTSAAQIARTGAGAQVECS